MNEEYLKGFFDANVAPERPDATYENWVSKIKDNEDYKSGMFNAYVKSERPDATYDDWNSKVFGGSVAVEKKNPNGSSTPSDGKSYSGEGVFPNEAELSPYIEKQSDEFNIDDVFNPIKQAERSAPKPETAVLEEPEEELITGTEGKPKQEWQKETEGNDRYKQAGFSGINNIISEYNTSIEDKQKAADEIAARMAVAAPTVSPSSMGGSFSRSAVSSGDKKKYDILNKEVEALKKIRRIYSDKKEFIDLEYGANMVGEDYSKMKKLSDEEKKLEGDVWEFFARNLPSFRSLSEKDVREWMDENMPDADAETKDLIIGKSKDGKTTSVLPEAGVFKDATIKQWTKERLEKSINEEIQMSDSRVKEKWESFKAEFEKDLENTNAYVNQLNQAYASNALSEDEYEELYMDAKISFDKQTVETSKRQEEFAFAADGYQETLRNIAIITQFDKQDWSEANIKSISNEWSKTPIEFAGLVKATAPILANVAAIYNAPGAAIESWTGGQDFTDSYSETYNNSVGALLDAYKPLTDLMIQEGQRNMLRVDTDKNLYAGQIIGQLSKIIPATMVAPVGAIVVTAGMSFDEMYQSAKSSLIESGMSEEQAEIEAVEMGTKFMPLGAALEMSGAGGVIANMGKKRVLKTALDIMMQEGLRSIGKKEATIQLNRSLAKELGYDILGGWASEGGTEGLQSATMIGLQLIENYEKGENVFKLSPRSVVDDIVLSTVVGGIAGSTISGVSTAFNVGLGKTNIQNIPYELYKQSVLDPKVSTKIIERVSTDKTLSQEQKNAALATMKRDRETFESVSQLGYTINEEKEAVRLISKRKENEAIIETSDKGSTKDLQDQNKVINEQLANIYRESKGKPTEETTAEKEAAKEPETKVETTIEPEVVVEDVPLTDEGNNTETVENQKEVVAEKQKQIDDNDSARTDEILAPKKAIDKVLETPQTDFETLTIEEAQQAYDEASQAIQEVKDSNISKAKKAEMIDYLNDLKNEIVQNESKFKTEATTQQTTKRRKVEGIRIVESEATTESGKPPKTVKEAVGKQVVYKGQRGTLKIGDDNAILFEGSDGKVIEMPSGSKNQQQGLAKLGIEPYVAPKISDNGTISKGGKNVGKLDSVNKDSDGNVTSYTYTDKSGKQKTVRDADEALDMAIQQQQQALGKIPDVTMERFSTTFDETVTEVIEGRGKIQTDPNQVVEENKTDEAKPTKSQDSEQGVKNTETETKPEPKVTPKADKSTQKEVAPKKAEPKAEKAKKPPVSKKETTKTVEPKPQKETPKPEPKKSEKDTKKEKVFEKIDDVFDLFKDVLGADLPKGTQQMSVGGLTQDQLLDGAKRIVKAMVGKGIDIQQAIQDVVAKLKENKLIKDETKFVNDLIEQMREPNITQKTYTDQAEKIAAEANMSGVKVGLIPDGKRGSYMLGRRTSDLDILEKARQAYISGEIDVRSLITRIVTSSDLSNMAISPMQVAALIHYKADLDAKVRDLEAKLQEAKDSNNESQAIILKATLDGFYADQDNFFNASERTGAAQSGGFRLRQYMLEDQYDATYQKSMIMRAIDPDGKLGYTLDPEIEEQLKAQAAEIVRIRKEVDKADARSKELTEKLYSLGKQKSGQTTSTPKKRRTATKEQAKIIADKLRGAKVKNGFSNNLYSNPVIPLMKTAWNVSLEASALAIEGAGITADIVETGVKAGLKALRGTEWYKTLNTNDKKRARKDVEQGVKDMVDSALENDASQIQRDEDGALEIPHSYISSLVDEGFDTLDKAKAEIERRLTEQGDTNFNDVEILEAINGYKKVSETTTPELQQKVSLLKSLAGLNAKLANLRENKKTPKNAKERRKQTKEEAILKRQIAKAEKNLTFTDAEIKEIWQETFKDTKKSLENLKEKLQEQLKEAQQTGEVVNPKSADTIKESVKKEAEIATLQTEIESIRSQIANLSQMKDIDFMRKAQIAEDALRKSIQRIQKQLDTKNFEPVSRKAPIETEQLNELRDKKEALEKQRDEESWNSDFGKKKRSETRIKNLQAKIDKLNDQINRKAGLATKRRAKDQATVQERLLQNIIKQKQETLKETQHYIDFAKKKYNEMAEKRAKQQIDKYEQILKDYEATGKIPEFKREQKEFSKGLRDLKRRQATAKIKVDILREKAIFQARSKPERILRNLMIGVGLPISLMASFDFSMVLRQGLPLALANPKQGVQAFRDMVKYGLKKNQSYTDEFMEGMKEWKYYDLAKQSKLYLSEPGAKLSAQEENFMGRLVQKIPHVRISSNLYNVYLNSLRMGIFEKFADLHIEGGRNALGVKQGGVDLSEKRTEKMFGDMAKLINNLSGRGSMFMTDGLQTSPVMNMLFFAPKYMTSRFNVVANTLGGYAILYHPAVALEAYRTVSTYVGVGMAFLTLMKLAGFEVEDDPRSTDFGKIKVDDDIRIDLWAGWAQVARLIAVSSMGSKKAITGKVTELNMGEYKQDDIAGIWFQFLRSKLSPFTSMAWDWASREKGLTQRNALGFQEPVLYRNLVGEDQTLSGRLGSMAAPLALQDIVSIWEDKGWKTAAVLFPVALGGAGVQYFKPKEKKMSKKPNFTQEELEEALLNNAMEQDSMDDMMFEEIPEDDLYFDELEDN